MEFSFLWLLRFVVLEFMMPHSVMFFVAVTADNEFRPHARCLPGCRKMHSSGTGAYFPYTEKEG
jgi:hypothetical protein